MGPTSDASRAEFQQWIMPLLGRAAGYAFAVVGNRDDAEDAVQDAALKGFRNRGRYDRSRPFKGWWFAIVRNSCLDLLRKRRAGPTSVPLDDATDPAAEGQAVGLAHEVCDALGQLTAAHREIIELRYFGDCAYRDIAEALGIPIGTVMSRLHAARQALAAVYREATP